MGARAGHERWRTSCSAISWPQSDALPLPWGSHEIENAITLWQSERFACCPSRLCSSSLVSVSGSGLPVTGLCPWTFKRDKRNKAPTRWSQSVDARSPKLDSFWSRFSPSTIAIPYSPFPSSSISPSATSGCGIRRVYAGLSDDVVVHTTGDVHMTPPWGLVGGDPALRP